jgi:Immunity protein 51
MADVFRLQDDGARSSLTFDCGDLPSDDAVAAAGHESSGHFWEGVATYTFGNGATGLDFDSDADMFAVYGERDDLERLRDLLRPLVNDGARIATLITKAEGEGFQFDA